MSSRSLSMSSVALLLLLLLLASLTSTQAQSSVPVDDVSRTYNGLTEVEHNETTKFLNIVMENNEGLKNLWGSKAEICDRRAVSCSKDGVELLVGAYAATKSVTMNPPDLNDGSYDAIVWDNVYITNLNFSHVRLSSSIDIGFYQLSRLRSLDFSNTAITGQLPADFKNLTNLSYLYLSNSDITGSLPSYSWPQMVGLDLSNTAITGTIPADFAVNDEATVYLADTNLCGCLPSSWSNYTRDTVANVALTGANCSSSCATTTTASPGVRSRDGTGCLSGAAAAGVLGVLLSLLLA